MGNQAPTRVADPLPNLARLEVEINRHLPVIQVYLRDPIKTPPEMYLIPDGAPSLFERLSGIPVPYDSYYGWFGHEDPIKYLERLNTGEKPCPGLDCIQFFVKVDHLGPPEERLIPNYSPLYKFTGLVLSQQVDK